MWCGCKVDHRSDIVVMMCLLAARSQLERETRHWPLVISETIIFNLLPVSEYCIQPNAQTDSNKSPLPDIMSKL